GVLESREYNKDSDLQGFWLSRDEIVNNGAKGQTGTIWNWHVIANSAEESTLLTHGKMQKEIKKLQEKLKREEKRKEEMENLPEKEKAGNKYIKKMETLKDQISGSKKQICDLTDELNRKPDIRTEFIVFCNVNKSKSNLSAHNELLSILISNYRICKHPSTTT
ncbi:hypothetical protein NEMIN01_2522, partial [Nematocida minor]|uniref:uncharacterized protein n=1 Tax=Nematocida minor TaxID=1912983 RepID=UPI002220E5D2